MFTSIAKSIFGDSNERVIKKFQPLVDQINSLEPEIEALDRDGIVAVSNALQERAKSGEDLEALLPEAFALVREAAKRTLGQRHFDVQLMGGITLHQGRIAEMRTGEGKTLVATLAAYLNALSGKGVHVVTVNDYLASRDSRWMGEIYTYLGLTVGCIVSQMSDEDRKAAYQCDITYGTNNEYGFDYLRDNLKFALAEMVQRGHHFAIVDEVDSILIDEARTPLIISGPSETSIELYQQVNELISDFKTDDYESDEKARSATLTETGVEHAETLLMQAGLMQSGTLYDSANVNLLHHISQALRAHKMFTKDKHYMVKNDELLIIDEFTGRAMQGRRFSDGLHQALEAKEKLPIKPENQTLASVTYQNYFRLYDKLSGMTGTALTEAGEFSEIYALDVVSIPTNKPVLRKDDDDAIYRTGRERDTAIIELIRECREKGQPILVGTVSIEKSEALSEALKSEKIPHNVLNARFHQEEAKIIADAGILGAVTIATNMAGRGTDIQLGGNLEMKLRENDIAPDSKAAEKIAAEIEEGKQKALAAGGLFVLGTERHESRRIDNQLRGRTGRQGDPGSSKFFLSLEDDLMRIFGSEKLDGMLQKLGLEEGESIAHNWINKAVEKAQSKVESHNFEIRKQLLKYDDVMNDQRQVVFSQRKDIMQTENVHDTILGMREETIDWIVSESIPAGSFPDMWDADLLTSLSMSHLGIEVPGADWVTEDGVTDGEITDRLRSACDRHMASKATIFGPDAMRNIEKSVILQILDQQWKEHLLSLDHLRQGINLRAYAQKDPLNEYKREAFQMFEGMLDKMRQTVTMALAHVNLRPQQNAGSTDEAPAKKDAKQASGETQVKSDKVPRNAPCPCGSGKKFKHCHGQFKGQV
ncbi:MAG: preprotein translocase subunit SecA [Alphaproteobacteria bacterium]|jgi:preprotein translocase subunit SecA|nr:preprotein translocase subunit SecA [Alphaproteobacteria bacterium]